MAGDNYSCNSFSERQMDAIFYTRVAACCVTFAACLSSLVVLCVQVCWLRVWNTFVHRLKLHLTAVALVVSLLYLLQVLPMKLGGPPQDGHTVSRSWNDGCKVIIYLLQYGDWVLMLLILWLVVYLCRIAWMLGRSATDSSVQHYQKTFEVLGTVAAYAVPLLVVWTPFVGGYYGADDHKWCEMDVKDSCTQNREHSGIGYFMGTWYVPAILVTLASTVGILVAITLLWRYYKRLGLTHQMQQTILKGIAPVTYLVLFNAINVVDGTNLIYHSLSEEDAWNGTVDYGLWLTHAVTGPGRAMAIPFGFILSHLFTECCWKNKRDAYNRLN